MLATYNSAMLSRKLLTLSCAAGIVGLGACFLPPIQPRQPPPPPPRLNFQGIRRINIAASNNSPSHHMDASALAMEVAYALKRRDTKLGVTANADDSKTHDGTLQIDIVKEAALPDAETALPDASRWIFEITLNATLTNREGKVVWSATNFLFRSLRPIVVPGNADVWSNRQSDNLILYPLSMELVAHLLNDD
jgi:hypothetical protein